jgi:hypothetical protein
VFYLQNVIHFSLSITKPQHQILKYVLKNGPFPVIEFFLYFSCILQNIFPFYLQGLAEKCVVFLQSVLYFSVLINVSERGFK